MERRWVLILVSCLMLTGLLLSPAVAAAEAGVQACFEGHITELFTGTEDCPQAQYVMVEGELLLPPDERRGVLVARLEGGEQTVFARLDQLPLEKRAAAGRILVATSQAQLLFGVTADVFAPRAILPARSGHLALQCEWAVAAEVRYGLNDPQSAPPLISGRALRRVDRSYRLSKPRPLNAAGKQGQMSRCTGKPIGGPGPTATAAPPDIAVIPPKAEPLPGGCLCSAPPRRPGKPLLPLLLLLLGGGLLLRRLRSPQVQQSDRVTVRKRSANS